MKKKVLFVIILVIVAFIWIQSFVPRTLSAQESGFFYELFKPFLEIFTGKGNLARNMVRKIAHFTEFAALGLFLGILFPPKKRNYLISCGIAFLIAFLDETIQIFSGRGPMIADVWLDLSGAAAAAGVVFLIRYFKSRR